MSEFSRCPLHDVEFQNLKERMDGMDKTQELIFSKLDTLKDEIKAGLGRFAVAAIAVLGSTVVGLIVFIVVELGIRGRP